MNAIVRKAGTLDILFSAIGLKDHQNVPVVAMALADVVRPVTIAMEMQFIAATAAGRVMVKQRSGIVLSLTALRHEGASRDLGAELGPYGVRVVNLRSVTTWFQAWSGMKNGALLTAGGRGGL